MIKLQQFIIHLASDVDSLRRSKHNEDNPISFVDFLGMLSDEQLQYYTNAILTVLEKEMPVQEELEIAAVFYFNIMTQVEGVCGESINIQDDKWVVKMFCFLMMEKFQRDKYISDFSGFLKDGQPTYNQSTDMQGEMKKYLDSIKSCI
ncbi:MAG: hypothetical protein ACTHJT_04075 [Cytophaga sp.]|uniref:hypothetical protein n=1 Tax=Cytophaga sp. TaxID=29535 RepID=UPI003F80C701